MLTVVCVLRSGGIYNADWVLRLKRGVERNLTLEHQFMCLSDMSVGAPGLIHKPLPDLWPTWWSKLVLFKPGLLPTRTLYLDLDTVIVDSIDWVEKLIEKNVDFAMLRSFHREDAVGSGVMWFGKQPNPVVYNKFRANPSGWIAYHERRKQGTYVGDQAFIWDALDHDVKKIQDYVPKGALVSFKKHCADGLPKGASVVAFHGAPKPFEVKDRPWMREAWA